MPYELYFYLFNNKILSKLVKINLFLNISIYRYLYSQLKTAIEGKSYMSIFQKSMEGKFNLKEDITFHMFTTNMPCKL